MSIIGKETKKWEGVWEAKNKLFRGILIEDIHYVEQLKRRNIVAKFVNYSSKNPEVRIRALSLDTYTWRWMKTNKTYHFSIVKKIKGKYIV